MKYAIGLTEDKQNIAVVKDFQNPQNRGEIDRFISEFEDAKLELIELSRGLI